MRFELLDSISLPSDPAKPNDDAFAHGGASAVVMDGATGLGEPLLEVPSDAAWVANYGAERLMAHMRVAPDADAALRQALLDTEREFATLRTRAPAQAYEIPVGSMMFVSLVGNRLDARWFGDCAVLIARPGAGVQILGDALAKRDRERKAVRRLAESLGAPPADASVRAVFLPALRHARNTVNTDAGGWLFGPDARAADRVASMTLAIEPGTLILLATDGFLALASDYDYCSVDALVDLALSRGLENLGQELRAIEDSDPQGKRFPRFKKSDDATAALLRVGM